MPRKAAQKPEVRHVERFPLGSYIQEELTARGWSTRDLAVRINVQRILVDECAMDMLIAVPDSLIDQEMAEDLARAFGVNPEFFLNLQTAYFSQGAPLREASPTVIDGSSKGGSQ